jgi:hypothetical protein
VCSSCSSSRGTIVTSAIPLPPIFGVCSPLSTLAEEFGKSNAEVKLRVKELAPSYPWWLKARGDGNSFYRALYMALLDFHCRSGNGGAALQGLLDSVEATDLTKSEFHLAAQVTCAAYLRSLIAGPDPPDPLSWREARIAYFVMNPPLDEELVVVLRALASSQLKQDYRKVAAGTLHSMVLPNVHTSFQEYCDKEVTSLGVSAESLVFPAITKALDISMSTVYFGSGKQAKQSASFDFTQEDPCQAHLLLKPGHYDVLFPEPSSAWARLTALALVEASDSSVLHPLAEPFSVNILSMYEPPSVWGNSLCVTHAYAIAPGEDSFFFAVIAGVLLQPLLHRGDGTVGTSQLNTLGRLLSPPASDTEADGASYQAGVSEFVEWIALAPEDRMKTLNADLTRKHSQLIREPALRVATSCAGCTSLPGLAGITAGSSCITEATKSAVAVGLGVSIVLLGPEASNAVLHGEGSLLHPLLVLYSPLQAG